MPESDSFIARVKDFVQQIFAAAEGNKDELIYLILRHDHTRLVNSSVANALHSAALSCILARRLQWPADNVRSLMGAALTMNVSIIELQGRLASRGDRPTADERQRIRSHPAESAQQLRAAGLDDGLWLGIVEEHHERPSGLGYPKGLDMPSDAAQLLGLVDRFVAKHSPRTGRTPVPAHDAARQLYVEAAGSDMVRLLIKELGIYPPGCYVRLANGEMAVVLRPGVAANKPVVACFRTAKGEVLARPQRRDTGTPDHAIVATVPDEAVRVTLSVEKLYER